MKILLTGGTGFIGSAFLNCALSRGHQIAALHRSPVAPKLVQPGLQWLHGSLADPPLKAIERFGPGICLHAAWITTPGIYLDSPENESYLRHSLQFLNAVCERGVSRLVVLGTCIEYEASPAPLVEEASPLAPVTNYARCKYSLHQQLIDSGLRLGFSLCWARVFHPYGPGEHPDRLCSWLIHKLCRGERVQLRTPASIKDFIYIDDLAAALCCLVENPFAGAINAGTGAGIAVRDLAETIADLLDNHGLLEFGAPVKPDPYPHVVADVLKLRRMGWRPETPLREGLRRLIERIKG